MDPLIESQFAGFLEKKGVKLGSLNSGQIGAEFELFSGKTILKHWWGLAAEPEELESMIVGGSGDNQLDVVAILAGGKVITQPSDFDQLDSIQGDARGVELVFAQATLRNKFAEQKMKSFALSVGLFLENDSFFVENPDLARRKELAHSIIRQLPEDEREDVTVHVFYVCMGRWREELRREELNGYDLELIFGSGPEALPEAGNNVLIIGDLDGVLCFRMFDPGGSRTVDIQESAAADRLEDIERLRAYLRTIRETNAYAERERAAILEIAAPVIASVKQGWRAMVRKLISRSGFTPGTIEIVDSDRLRGLLEKLEVPQDVARPVPQSYEGRLTGGHFMEIAPKQDGERGFLGFVPAGPLLEALEDPERQGMRDEITAAAFRGFAGYASPVSKKIVETLQGGARAQFFFRNHGITFVAEDAQLEDGGQVLVLQNFQIVDGMQTCQVLYEMRDEIGRQDDVLVAVKVAVSRKAGTREAIVEATNLHTPVTHRDLLGGRPFVRALEESFARRGGGVILERRQGQFWTRRDSAGVSMISLEELVMAFAAVILECPYLSKEKAFQAIPKRIFHDKHPHELYLAAAKTYAICRGPLLEQQVETEPEFVFYWAFALRVGLVRGGLPLGVPRETQAEYGRKILDRLADEPEREKILERSFKLCAEYAGKSKAGKKSVFVLPATAIDIRRRMIADKA